LPQNLNGDPDAPIENHPKYKDAVAAAGTKPSAN